MTSFCYFHSVLVIKVRLERFLHRAAGGKLPHGLRMGPKSSPEPTNVLPRVLGELQAHSGGFGAWEEQYSPRALQLLQIGSVPLRALQQPQTHVSKGPPNSPFPQGSAVPQPSHPPELTGMLGTASETGIGH